MQTPNIGATIQGIDKKAADFARCSFDDIVTGKSLNEGILRAGQTVKVKCHWDANNLKWLRLES